MEYYRAIPDSQILLAGGRGQRYLLFWRKERWEDAELPHTGNHFQQIQVSSGRCNQPSCHCVRRRGADCNLATPHLQSQFGIYCAPALLGGLRVWPIHEPMGRQCLVYSESGGGESEPDSLLKWTRGSPDEGNRVHLP